MALKIGDKAPQLLGTDENGNEVTLDRFKGRKLVLYFYPKDNTPGCTNEACNLRDNYDLLKDAGYEIVGVSPDSAASHQKFIAKHGLPFTLITDPDHTLLEQFGAWGEKVMCGKTRMGVLRSTFVIDSDGTIVRAMGPKEVKVKQHASQILSDNK